MKDRRRIALVAAGAVVLVLATLAAFPLLFRDRVVALVKAQVDSAVDARVDWGGTHLTLLRTFPNLTLRLDDVAVTGVGAFEGDTLVSAARFALVLDAWSLLRGLRGRDAFVIRSIELDRPAVHLLVLEDGSANWAITRPTEEPAEPGRDIALRLRKLEVRNGSIRVENRQSDLAASVAGLNQTLRGDFAAGAFTLRAVTNADAVSLRFAGVPYLAGVRLGIDADVTVDNVAGIVTLNDNEFRLNELLLTGTGSFSTAGDSSSLDIAFASPRTAFRDILSLVPAIYARDFAALQTSGSMAVEGRVAGGYGNGLFPALSIRATVEDGMFRYPDLPLPAEGIRFDMTVENPGGDIDSTVVRLEQLRVVIGGEPITGSFTMRTPVSDPDISFRLAGRADLADVARTVRFEDMERMAGIITADAAMRARMSHLEQGRYEQVSAEGGITVAQLVLEGMELPHALLIEEAALRLTPRHAELSTFRGRIGSSDITLAGELDNLIGFLLRADDLRGRARLASSFFDLNEWRSDDAMQAIIVPGRIDFELDAAVERLAFNELDIRDARGRLRVRDRRVALDGFRMAMLGGAVAVDGFYETVTGAERPAFDVHVRMTDVDVPTTFASINTVRAFAPVARYATGSVSADVRLTGELEQDMMPVFGGLSGRGTFEAIRLALEDFPPLTGLASLVRVEQLRNPTLEGVQSTFEIRDGRMHVRPFDVRAGEFTMSVAGSNGFDQSLDYALVLRLPRAVLGVEADRAITGLVSQAGRVGVELQRMETISLGVQLGGSVNAPTFGTTLVSTTDSRVDAIEQGLRDEAARRVDAAGERVDSAATEARRRAQAEAERAIAEAEQRADAIRAEARDAAEKVRQEGYAQADALVERASGAVARAAARTAADRLRREADQNADRITREADARADALVAEARRRAGGDPPDGGVPDGGGALPG
jgi:hypothetical protein